MDITQEQLNIIQTVIKSHSHKYRIPGYEQEDIEQEAFLIALEAMKSWNENIGPLENFLSVFISNRLISFVRSQLKLNFQCKDSQKALLSAVDISLLTPEEKESLIDKNDVIERVEQEEIVRKIDEYLPVSLRKDFLRMRAGVKIGRGRAKKIYDFVTVLLKELKGEHFQSDDLF